METEVLAFRRIDTAVHRAEEEVGAIAERDFEILNAEREGHGTTEVRYSNRALAGEPGRGISVASIRTNSGSE